MCVGMPNRCFANGVIQRGKLMSLTVTTGIVIVTFSAIYR